MKLSTLLILLYPPLKGFSQIFDQTRLQGVHIRVRVLSHERGFARENGVIRA